MLPYSIMKYSKKKGGSPAYALLRQQGSLSTINPVNSSVPLTYFRTDNVSLEQQLRQAFQNKFSHLKENSDSESSDEF